MGTNGRIAGRRTKHKNVVELDLSEGEKILNHRPAFTADR